MKKQKKIKLYDLLKNIKKTFDFCVNYLNDRREK